MTVEEIEKCEALFPKGSIIDGAVDAEKYLESRFRIAWFLKEAYTKEDATTFEGYHISEHYGQDNAYENFFKGKSTQTWHPIIYCSYGILNGFIKYEDVDFIKNDPSMCDVIKQIAIINANKFVSKTGSYTLHQNLNEAFEQFKEIIASQINVLQPQIHILCNTFYLYKDFLGLTDEHKVLDGDAFHKCTMYIKDAKLFLDVYHPANFSMLRENYVDQIIAACEIWANKNLLS